LVYLIFIFIVIYVIHFYRNSTNTRFISNGRRHGWRNRQMVVTS